MMFHSLKLEIFVKKKKMCNVSCNIYPSGLVYSQPQTVLLLLSFLIPAEDGKVLEGTNQNRAIQDQKGTLNSEYCHITLKKIKNKNKNPPTYNLGWIAGTK